jgi:hypothetical protein
VPRQQHGRSIGRTRAAGVASSATRPGRRNGPIGILKTPSLCDRFLLLSAGRLVGVGTLAELREQTSSSNPKLR